MQFNRSITTAFFFILPTASIYNMQYTVYNRYIQLYIYIIIYTCAIMTLRRIIQL